MRHQQNANTLLKQIQPSNERVILQSINQSEFLVRFSTSLHHQYGILVTEIQTSLFYKTAPLKNTMEVGCVWRTTGGCFGSSYHVLILIWQIEEHHLVSFTLYYHWLTSLWQPSFAFAIKSRKKAPLGCSHLQRLKSRQLPTFLVGMSTLKLIDSTENII